MKNCEVAKTNGFNKFCSCNKFHSGTPCAPKKETLNKLMAVRSEVKSYQQVV